MKKPFSWLKFFNVVLFQWFFIRLSRCDQEAKVGIDPEIGTLPLRWYSITGLMWPTTGWKDDYKMLFNMDPFYWRVTPIMRHQDSARAR